MTTDYKVTELFVSVSAMLVYILQTKNIAQVFILERYFFVSIYPAAIPGTYLAVSRVLRLDNFKVSAHFINSLISVMSFVVITHSP